MHVTTYNTYTQKILHPFQFPVSVELSPAPSHLETAAV